MQDPQTELGRMSVSKGQGGFAGNVLTLGGGATVAHLIAFCCAPITNRLFSPEAFGTMAMFSAIVLIAGVALTLRYEAALVLPARDEDAANLLALSCICVAAGAGLLFLAIALTGDSLARILNAEELARYKWLIPIGAFAWSMGLPLRAWAIRHKRFGYMATASISETGASSAGRIAAGLAQLTGSGPLIVTDVTAKLLSAAVLAVRPILRDVKFIAANVSWRQMMELGRKHIRFPLVDSWSAILRQGSRFVPPLLLGASLGQASAGHYSRAVVLGHIPFLLIGNSVAQVFYQQAAASHAEGKPISALVQEVTERLVWIALFPMEMLALIGSDIFRVVLGAQWGPAGQFSRILAVWLFLEAVALPLTGLIRILGRFGAGLAFNTVLVAGQIIALAIGGWAIASPQVSVVLLAGVGAAVHGGLCLFLLRESGASLRRAANSLVRYFAYSLPALTITGAAKWWLGLANWKIVLIAIVTSLSYLVLVVRHDKWASSKLSALVSKARPGQRRRS